MAKQQLTFVALLVLQGVALSLAAPKSAGSSTFDEWLKTFDPSTAVASKLANCVGKADGFYPESEPEVACTNIYTACVFQVAYEQRCTTGEVYDSTVSRCADRYDAKSAICEYTVPTPSCTADNIGEYRPTARCSDLYYVCLPPVGSDPQFQFCNPGMPTYFFDEITGRCQTTAGAKACETTVEPEVPPPTVPEYGCGSDKINGYAYAITECSVSFYTCDRTVSSSPIPQSCNTYGTGKVFDYKATPSKPSSASCVLKSAVTDCTANFLGQF